MMVKKSYLSALAGALGAVFCAGAETYVWTNANGDSDWSNSANWSPATGVPKAGDTASFTSNASIGSGFSLASGTLTVSVASGVTLDFNGAISGPDDGQLTLTSPVTTGCGTINFNASSTFTGMLRINYGEVHGTADDAFGVPGDDDNPVYLNANNKYCKLYFDGIRNLKRISHNCNDANAAYKVTCYFSGENTLGKYQNNGTARLSVTGGKTTFTGRVYNPSITIYNIAAAAELIITNTPAQMFFYEEGGPGPIVLKCTNNVLTCGNYPFRVPVRCDVNGALAATTDLLVGSKSDQRLPCFDLNGTTQTVRRIQTSPARDYLGTVKSAVDGLLTMTGNYNITNGMAFTEDVSLEVAVPSGKTVTLTAESTTTGDLIATSGNTVVAAGACWGGDMRVSSGATVVFESAVALSDTSTIRLDGGTVTLSSGTIAVKALIDSEGVSRAPGLYAATSGGGATAVEGLAGDGFVQVLPAASGEPVVWLWNGSSNDGKFSTPGNWEDEEGTAATADDFDVLSPDNVFRFPSVAEVTVDVPVYAKGLVFDGEDAGTASFSASGDGAITIFGGGYISVTNIASVAKVVDFDVPVNFQGEVHMGTLSGSTVRFDGPLNSVGSGDFVKHGYGSWYISGDSNIIYGDVVNSNGLLTVSGKDPLGGSGVLYNYQHNYDSNSRIYLSNAVVNRSIVNSVQGNPLHGALAIVGNAGTTNVVNGVVINRSGHLRLSGGTGCETTYNGGVQAGNLLIPNSSNFSVIRFAGTTINTDRQYYADGDNKSICAIAATNCKFQAQMFICTTLRTEVDNALASSEYFRLAKNYGRVDLWGTTQRVANAYVDVISTNSSGQVTKITCQSTVDAADGQCGGNIKSDRPGAYIAFVGNTTYTLTPTFGGSVSLERAGKGTNIFYRANTSTGEVVLTSGKLRFAAPGETWMHNGVAQTYLSTGGTWAGDLATVNGGVLAIGHSKAFPKTARFRLAGGALELDDGVVQPVYSLELLVDGEWKRQRSGYWGSSENTSVSGLNRTSLIKGSGILKVLGDGWGMRVILK